MDKFFVYDPLAWAMVAAVRLLPLVRYIFFGGRDRIFQRRAESRQHAPVKRFMQVTNGYGETCAVEHSLLTAATRGAESVAASFDRH